MVMSCASQSWRWLSWDSVLKQFFDLKEEIKAFMKEERLLVVEFDDKWVMDLAFLAIFIFS